MKDKLIGLMFALFCMITGASLLLAWSSPQGIGFIDIFWAGLAVSNVVLNTKCIIK
jgi:hypothetical protein